MNFIESIILGIVQGLTEFLPISSSGHLVIFQNIFKIASDNIAFEVFVHFGTLLSVVAVYYNDLLSIIRSFFSGITKRGIGERYRTDSYFRLAIYIVVGTIPAVLAGLFLKDFITSIFHSVLLVGFALIVTGMILVSTRFVGIKDKPLTLKNVIVIGVAQMCAILPGISRSGFTISMGLFFGISRDESARFSFLLAVPAILGATILETGDLLTQNSIDIQWGVLLTGMLISFIFGYAAIRILLRVLRSGKFSWFAPYCYVAGLVVLLLL